MGKICTLTIPTSIEGINTTIDVGSGCIHHAVFDNGISRDRMYDILSHGDFSGSKVHVITDNFEEFNLSTMEYTGVSVDAVTRSTEFLNIMKSVVDDRYDTLNETNNKNFEYYNIWFEPKHCCYYDKMTPMVICWLGADKVLKQMNREETYELLKTFLRLGQVTGITLLLHSDEPYGIRKAVDNDIYAQFVQIHVPTTEHAEDTTVLVGDKEYHTSVVQKDMV